MFDNKMRDVSRFANVANIAHIAHSSSIARSPHGNVCTQKRTEWYVGAEDVKTSAVAVRE